MSDHTSIILVTHNQLEYTKLCVESIERLTPEPFEFVFVDNGSRDGSVEWLKSLGLRVESGEPEQRSEVRDQSSGANGPLRVTVIANAENRGFPAVANQGIRAASGQQILLLNNDTVVTSGWLTRMLKALHSPSSQPSPRTRGEGVVGMVGPVSNFVSGEQQITTVEYERHDLRFEISEPEEDGRITRIDGRPGGTVVCDLSKLDEFARKWGEANEGKIVETDRLVGFCLLIRREVVDRIGLLDERFGIGNFEDDDYCRRARAAGFRLAIATDAFVHHFGGRTFIGSGVDHGALMRRNERLFREKWRNGRESRARRRGSVIIHRCRWLSTLRSQPRRAGTQKPSTFSVHDRSGQ
jgi:GT2 family glycosyltransferase